MAEKPSEQSIFLHAVGLASAGDRAAYLEDVCRDHPRLRLELDGLLAAHDRLGADPPPSGPGLPRTIDEPVTEHPGTIIGSYKLIEQVGEGGMGTVWMAQQTEPVKRLVAVKLIKAGMDSAQVIARFEAERQALALMDHPNIARVLDAGTIGGEPGRVSAGRPYFVMDLVKGVPITRYCDEHHLTPRQRLELFIPVCQAIQHAHQKGIVHRDLKPSNVLVAPYDGNPVVKVIDFGVAKAAGQQLTERTLVTGFGAIVGTLEYMSPEQAELNNHDIDTRSDIYALGVLLYELLTGTTPFSRKELEKAGMMEMLRVIREQEPSKPSTKLSTAEGLPTLAANRGTEPAKLARLVRGELDWIVMKALEKDRSRRYETANGFADDVRRYLADEPVQACPPSARYRLRKFVRKNRKALVTAGAFLVLLGAAAVVSTWQAFRAMAAAAAEKEAKETAQARQRETEAVLDFVENNIFAAAKPEGEGGLGHDVSLRKAVEAALPFMAHSFADQPLIEARLRMTLGISFSQLGEDRIASDQFEAARTLYTKHLGSDHADTLGSVSRLAACYTDVGRLEEAVQLLEETLARQKVSPGPDHAQTLWSMNALGKCYFRLGRQSDATRLAEETLTLRRARLGPYDRDTLISMHNLASAYSMLGRHADAAKMEEETLALVQTKLGSEYTLAFWCMHALATNYYFLGRPDEGLKLEEKVLALRKASLGPDHPLTLMSMQSLSNSYYFVFGRHADALKLSEETLARARAKLGADHPRTLWSMSSLAWFLATGPDLKLRNPRRALELAKKAVQASPKEAEYWEAYGVARYRTGDWTGAVETLEKAISLRKPDDPLSEDASHGFFLAMAHRQLGDKAKARHWFDKSVQWMEKELSAKKGWWPHDEELKRLHAEAAELIGMKQKSCHEHRRTTLVGKNIVGCLAVAPDGSLAVGDLVAKTPPRPMSAAHFGLDVRMPTGTGLTLEHGSAGNSTAMAETALATSRCR
jgi:eukaryotic-like serine/threonine-protein kinase